MLEIRMRCSTCAIEIKGKTQAFSVLVDSQGNEVDGPVHAVNGSFDSSAIWPVVFCADCIASCGGIDEIEAEVMSDGKMYLKSKKESSR